MTLRRFTLSHDAKKQDWKLVNDATGRTVQRFETKADGTKGGVLARAVGPEGGSVRIEESHGGFQEERTFPRSSDPKKSPG